MRKISEKLFKLNYFKFLTRNFLSRKGGLPFNLSQMDPIINRFNRSSLKEAGLNPLEGQQKQGERINQVDQHLSSKDLAENRIF